MVQSHPPDCARETKQQRAAGLQGERTGRCPTAPASHSRLAPRSVRSAAVARHSPHTVRKQFMGAKRERESIREREKERERERERESEREGGKKKRE